MPLDPTVPVREAAVNAVADKVGNLVSTIWDYSLGLVANIIFLSWKAEEVAGEMKKLEEQREDLHNQVTEEVRKNAQADMSKQLSGWMSRVSNLAEDASSFQRSFEDGSLCVTRFRLGYEAVELLRRTKRLTDERKEFLADPARLLCPRGRDPVEQVPAESSSSTLVGGGEALRAVERHILDDGVGIIGIYGMGGVGKTTLLKIINNEFLGSEACRDRFEVAIWVTVSRDVQISAIQESIAARLGLELPSNTSIGKEKLFRVLSKKRFVLLLDDVWERLDLVEIGIPLPKNSNNKSKILFTTRTRDVCGKMDANETVNVTWLDDISSWELFRSKLGRDAAAHVFDDSDIRQLAEEVVSKCGGLPIALITVGRAMSNARTTYDWEDAKMKLDQCGAELLEGMEEVLKSLKFSYNMLKDDALQKCLLYCALFPEDYEIPKEKIIDYWICEGFLDHKYFDEDINIETTRRRGNVLISNLQNACLLEEGSDGTVMLHDTVRDMALWIAGQKFVVMSFDSNKKASQQIPKLNIWESVQRISLIKTFATVESQSSLFSSPLRNLSCPNLTTLLALGKGFTSKIIIPKEGFFNFTSMAALRVLDLTLSGLQEFPTEITSLTCLRYLNLSHNSFTSLPVELGNLTNLRHLILRYTLKLSSIPEEAILRLSRLQILDMEESDYVFDHEDVVHPAQLELSHLEDLERLCELYLPNKCSWTSLGVIADSPVLRPYTRHLDLVIRRTRKLAQHPPQAGGVISDQIGSLSELRTLALWGEPSGRPVVMVELQLYPVGRLRNLEVLRLLHLSDKYGSTIVMSSLHGSEPDIFPRLRRLYIRDCDGWCSELTWVGRLPSLEILCVHDCGGLREVLRAVDGGGADSHHDLPTTPSFPKLKHMTLLYLPSLTSISARPLLFPCLECLDVLDCPLLRRLPFGPQSAWNLQSIHGQKAWWDGMEWEDHHAQHQQGFFSSKFHAS